MAANPRAQRQAQRRAQLAARAQQVTPGASPVTGAVPNNLQVMQRGPNHTPGDHTGQGPGYGHGKPGHGGGHGGGKPGHGGGKPAGGSMAGSATGPYTYRPPSEAVTVPPFLTAQNQIDSNDAYSKYVQALNQIDYDLEKQRIDNEYEKQGYDKERLYNLRDANDSAAARGLFHSSIRDAELYDIDATTSIRKRLLDDQLTAAGLDGIRRKEAAQFAWDQFQLYMNQQAVENAQDSSVEAGASDPGTGSASFTPGWEEPKNNKPGKNHGNNKPGKNHGNNKPGKGGKH